MATVTVLSTTYDIDREHDGDPGEPVSEKTETYNVDDYADSDGGWNDEGTEWIPAPTVAMVAALLKGQHGTDMWATDCSATAADIQQGIPGWSYWYTSHEEHPYDGTYTERTATIDGLTGDEAADVYRRVLGKHAP